MTDAQILQIFGLIYVAIGVGMVVNDKYLESVFKDFFKVPAIAWVFGIMAMVLGFLIVTRDAGTGGWSILITVIGWIALVKGGFGLILPKPFHKIAISMMKYKPVMMMAQWVILLGGAIMAYVGFAIL